MCSLSQALPAGELALQLGVKEFSLAHLASNQAGWVLDTPYSNLYDASGNTLSLYGFRFELDLLWQQSQSSLLELSIPYVDQELSPYAGQALPSTLIDANARKTDTYGDLSLLWRSLILGQPQGPWRCGAGLDVSVPTGQGPFSATHPLAATGLGDFAAALLLDVEGGSGATKGWLQGRVPYELGYSADIPPGTFVAASASPLSGGRAWVSRAFSYTADAGLGWDWYSSEHSRHSLALEVQLDEQGAMKLDGAEVTDSYSMELDVVPEARFSFDKVLSINFGWILPTVVENRAFGTYGDVLLRLDYGL